MNRDVLMGGLSSVLDVEKKNEAKKENDSRDNEQHDGSSFCWLNHLFGLDSMADRVPMGQSRGVIGLVPRTAFEVLAIRIQRQRRQLPGVSFVL